MSKVAVVFWSGTGNTQTMADAVAAGAQGAGADEAVASFTAYGKGGIVNASRSIMNAWQKRADFFKPEDFGKAARFEAEDMKEKLNAALMNRKYV